MVLRRRQRVDPARIVAEAKRLADFDVLCLQEIADNFPHPRLGGSDGEDQFAVLASLLPGYTAVPGVAVDHPADGRRRRRFGNMILSRLPVRQVVPAPAALAGRPGRDRHAAHRGRGGGRARRSATCASSRRTSSSTRRSSARAQVEALRAIYAEGHAACARRVARRRTRRAVPHVSAAGGDDHHRRLQPRARRSAACAHAGAVRRRHAAAAPMRGRSLHPGAPIRRHSASTRRWVPGDPELHCDFIFVSDGSARAGAVRWASTARRRRRTTSP